ncbi:BTAD domain-containing putative transcriptional regulator, partial [Sphaerisporangium sp. NPDC049002]|uniref:BTAD domain-containing putative transcriptional regulator n=1 Tax=Sphaerisporangium sp. NPDC049002 TaxID=3155392 RepID=UPI0034109FE5
MADEVLRLHPGHADQPIGRALSPAGTSPDRSGRALSLTGSSSYRSGRVLSLAGRSPDRSGHAVSPVEVPQVREVNAVSWARRAARSAAWRRRATSAMEVELVGELTELVWAYPTRERLRGQLMTALYR